MFYFGHDVRQGVLKGWTWGDKRWTKDNNDQTLLLSSVLIGRISFLLYMFLHTIIKVYFGYGPLTVTVGNEVL